MGNIISDEILKYIDFDNGFYLESGAQNGLLQSNSLRLEQEKGWKGILIEPSPNAFNECQKNRSRENNIMHYGALVGSDYEEPTITGDFYGLAMSSINGKRLNKQDNFTIEVPAYTLNEVLELYKIDKLDFLSLDIEGFEYWVIKDFDFKKWHPKFCLIEWNVGEDELFPFMESNGYENLLNISNFNLIDDVNYDSQRQDYLFKLKD